MNRKIKSLFIVPLLLVSCELLAQQGITGSVVVRAGNQMPSPDEKMAAPRPVKRVVLIYELTRQDQAVMENGIFSAVKTRLVKQTRSKRNGRFRVMLPPGRYTVFVKEIDGLYANQWDAKMNIHPVTVEQGVFAEIRIEITRAATF
jgi:hypothetical protein